MLSALLSLCLAVSSQTVVFAAPDVFEGGSNVEGFLAPIDDPDASAIRIKTPQDLAAVSENMRGSYILMNDIDLTEYGNWSVIGKTLANPFQGKFDGQGHTISGLTVSVSFDSGTLLAPTYAVGLFGVCDGAQIKNLALENVNISISTASGYRYENSILDSDGTVFAGAIAGYLKNSSVIYNCTASGSVSASASDEGYSPTVAGGLIGFGDTAVLSYCHNAADVTAYNGNSYQAENSYAGGLAGRFEKECIIDRSYNGGAVSARTLDYGISYAGGLIADASKSIATVTDSFNEGNVQSISGNQFCDPAYAGGIAAQFLGSINRTYNSGTVRAQANDPYDINSTKAYAGGICGSTYPAATISNVAIVQAVVSATASGQRYQSRIADSGTKTNTISIRTMSAGSNNDAEIIKDLDDMKQAKPYEEELGWDFTRVWEMVSGHEFPQLKQVDTSSEEYNQDYVDQHLDFIDSGKYQQIMDRYRWAQIYWSQENNFESNLAGALYSGADAIVDIATLNLGALFDEGNPFKVLLADYISDQTVEQAVVELYKVKIPFALDKKYKAAKGFIQKHWKDGWGELSDEDLFWLFHYEDKPSEEWINENFENHISEIVEETRNSGEDLAKVLEITTETLDTILEQKKNLDNAVDWLNGLIKYSGHVAAYLQADAEFKTILEEMCGNLPEFTPLEAKYKVQLYTALKSYTQYNNSQHLASRIFLNYLIDSTVGSFADTIKKTINVTPKCKHNEPPELNKPMVLTINCINM